MFAEIFLRFRRRTAKGDAPTTETPASESAFHSSIFRIFYVAQCLSFAGDGLRSIAIPLIVYSLTRSAFSVGVTYAIQTASVVVTSLISGHLADRVNRRHLMVAADFGRFLVLGCLALLAVIHALTIAWIYVAVFVLSVLSALFVSCTAPTLANILSNKQLTSGVSSIQSADAGTKILMNSLGGAALQSLGTVWTLALNAIAYFISQTYLLRISLSGQAPSDETADRDEKDDNGVFSGFRFVFQNATLRLFAIVSAVLNVTNTMESVIIVPWLKERYSASDSEVGFFFTILSLGALAGFSLASRLPRLRFGHMYAVLLGLHALLFVPVAILHNIWISVAFWTVADVTLAAAVSLMISWRIRTTPKDKVGRMMSALRVLVLLGTVPGALIAGSIAQRNLSQILWIIAALYLALAVLSASVRRLRAEAG